jgi:hypothetical protein
MSNPFVVYEDVDMKDGGKNPWSYYLAVSRGGTVAGRNFAKWR